MDSSVRDMQRRLNACKQRADLEGDASSRGRDASSLLLRVRPRAVPPRTCGALCAVALAVVAVVLVERARRLPRGVHDDDPLFQPL